MTKKRAIIAAISGFAAIVFIGIAYFGVNAAVNNPTRLLSLGERYLLEMDYEQAVIYFERVIKIEPKNARAYIGLAEAYDALGQTDKAIETLRLGLERTDDLAIAAYLATLELRNAPAVAQTEEPTPKPTSPPNAEPTQEPTAEPTEAVKPTIEPTEEQNAAPTETATPESTVVPAAEPTAATAVAEVTATPTAEVVLALATPVVTQTPAIAPTNTPTAMANPLSPHVASVIDDILTTFATHDVEKTMTLLHDIVTPKFLQALWEDTSYLSDYYIHSIRNLGLYENKYYDFAVGRHIAEPYPNLTIYIGGIEDNISYNIQSNVIFISSQFDYAYTEQSFLWFQGNGVFVPETGRTGGDGEYAKWDYTFGQPYIRVNVTRGNFVDGGYNGEVTMTVEERDSENRFPPSIKHYTAFYVDGYLQKPEQVKNEEGVLPQWLDENGSPCYWTQPEYVRRQPFEK